MMNYLIKGNEKYLKSKKIADIMKKHDINKQDLINYDMEDPYFNFDNLMEDLYTSSFFMPNKLIILKNPIFFKKKLKDDNVRENDDKELKSLMDFLKHPNNETHLILLEESFSFNATLKVYKDIVKEHLCEISEFKEYDERTFILEAKALIASQNISIDTDALNYLINNSNQDMMTLINNLKVLKLYGEHLDLNAVSNLITRSLEDDIFKFTNAIFSKDIKISMKIVDDFILNGMNIFQINATIASQLRFMNVVDVLVNYEHYSIKDTADITHSKEFRIKKTLESINKFKNINILNILAKLAKLDQKLKSDNTIDDKTRFELFLLEMMRG